MSDEFDSELITSASMLAPPPPLRHKEVVLPNWKTRNGKAAKFLVWELSGGDFASCGEEGWVYKDGVRVKYNDEDNDLRFLAYTIRDKSGNRLWPKVADAKAVLSQLGRSNLQILTSAVNDMNAKLEDVEGNSEGTQSDSSS